ncbi:MAG: gliding motility lipoprotein GldH [Odoribacteraceae bacterium]|jgi:gliding motility-associated lipoprotein GldH|nr:gliding motility lipoprotein GldH [Odoribacteraceae bacterium]
MKRLLLFLLLLPGCSDAGREDLHEAFRDIPGEQWDRDSVIAFPVEIPAAGPRYLTLYLRHVIDIDQANLTCIVSLARNGLPVAEERADIRFVDERGRWRGKGSLLKTITHPVTRPVEVDTPGHYTVQVQHWMKQKRVKAITAIGIQLHGKE